MFILKDKADEEGSGFRCIQSEVHCTFTHRCWPKAKPGYISLVL